MIKINVFSEERAWSKRLKKKEIIFKKICKSFPKKYKGNYLGDIIISYDYMEKPKTKNLKIFKEKVTKTFIHGFLHLLGYDHIRNYDYKKMIKLEESLFRSVISKDKLN